MRTKAASACHRGNAEKKKKILYGQEFFLQFNDKIFLQERRSSKVLVWGLLLAEGLSWGAEYFVKGAHHRDLDVAEGVPQAEGEIVLGVLREGPGRWGTCGEGGPCRGEEPCQDALAWEWVHREGAFPWGASFLPAASSRLLQRGAREERSVGSNELTLSLSLSLSLSL